MKTTLANTVRANTAATLADFFRNAGEDVGMIASNTLNFPIVVDGEEGWVEVVVKVPKGTKDEEYDGYGRRTQYAMDCEEKAAKKAKAAEEKAAKVAKKQAKKEKAE